MIPPLSSRPFIYLGALLALGFALLGYGVVQAVQRGREFDRYLTVRGASEREVKATLAIWPLRFAVTAGDLPTLKERMEQARATVIDYLKGQGISEAEVSLGLPTISDRHELGDYGQNPNLNLPRYRATLALVVRSRAVDTVKTAIQKVDQLLTQGVTLAGGDYSDRPEFSYDGLNEVKPEMIAEATANARQSAEKFAADSQSHVGGIRKATQGVVDLYDRDADRLDKSPARVSRSPEIKVLRVVTTVEFFLE